MLRISLLVLLGVLAAAVTLTVYACLVVGARSEADAQRPFPPTNRPRP